MLVMVSHSNEVPGDTSEPQEQTETTAISTKHSLTCSSKFLDAMLFPYMVTEGEVPSIAMETEPPEDEDDLTSFAEFKEKIIQSKQKAIILFLVYVHVRMFICDLCLILLIFFKVLSRQ